MAEYKSVLDKFPPRGSKAHFDMMEKQQAIQPDTTLEDLMLGLPRAGLAVAKGLAKRTAPAKKYHPEVQKAIDEGRMPDSMGEFMSGYARSKGNAEIGTGGYGSDGASEKMANYLKNMRSGKEPLPAGRSLSGAPKGGFTPLPKGVDYSAEELRKLPMDDFKKGGAVSASKRADGIAQRGKTRGKIC